MVISLDPTPVHPTNDCIQNSPPPPRRPLFTADLWPFSIRRRCLAARIYISLRAIRAGSAAIGSAGRQQLWMMACNCVKTRREERPNAIGSPLGKEGVGIATAHLFETIFNVLCLGSMQCRSDKQTPRRSYIRTLQHAFSFV